METKVNKQEQQVLLVSDAKDNKIKGVKGLSENGRLQSAPVNKANLKSFLKVDKHGDFFSNFFSNFFSQLKDPTQFSFFKVPESLALNLAKQMQEELDQKQSINKELYLEHQIDPDKVIESLKREESSCLITSKEYNPYKYNINELNWEALSEIGLSKQKLDEMDLLEPLLKGYKTKDLVMVNLDLGAAVFSLDARLSLKRDQNGEVVMNLEGVKKYPNLNVPFQGHEFTKLDKHNLLKTGNMGRVVELIDPVSGQKVPSVVSVDRLTNNLAVTSVQAVKVPVEIKGVELSAQQIQKLKHGEAVLVQGMNSSKGNPFDAEIQYNASKGHIEFLFDNVNKKNQKTNQEDLRVFRGKTLSDSEYNNLLQGKAVFVQGIIDKRGNPYNGYVSYDKVNNKTSFSFDNPINKDSNQIKNTQEQNQTSKDNAVLRPR
ncbi:DUF3945 domain-containing protein [Myroides albus]|uniref:DUF3945 domain-containing protein n=1 Tax=Myroides albus TaxID=2562892 RepID=UPI002158AD45|nr:DUF3945 domain-containing protein [Myroides albus]UVD79126.1 DUF3945 domain-containing protein [Myroides albus]